MSEEVDMLKVLSEGAKNIEVNDLDSILATLSKYERLLDKFIGIYNRLDRSGVIPVILRVIGKRAQIDVDKPIVNPLSIVAKSATHRAFFEFLNDLDEKDVSELHKQILLSISMVELDERAKNQAYGVKGANNRNHRSEKER